MRSYGRRMLVTLNFSRHCVLQYCGQLGIVCGSVGMSLLPKADLRGIAGGLMTFVLPDDCGIANHKQNTRAVDGSHFTQAGDARRCLAGSGCSPWTGIGREVMSDSQSCLRNKVAATSSWFPCPGPPTICLQSAMVPGLSQPDTLCARHSLTRSSQVYRIAQQ